MDRERRLAYQAQWKRKRRATWFQENGPCIDCSSWENLELDHVDASLKVDHNVWSWSEVRLKAELAKCVPRCKRCHILKTVAAGELRPVRAERHPNAKLNAALVKEIRRIRDEEHLTFEAIGARFGLSRVTVNRVYNRTRWGHVP